MSLTIVLVAAPEHLATLQAHPELIQAQAFTDAEALRALDVIIKQRPAVVALEHAFATSSRGSALINRIKADPSLGRCAIRIITTENPAIGPLPPVESKSSRPSVASKPGAKGAKTHQPPEATPPSVPAQLEPAAVPPTSPTADTADRTISVTLPPAEQEALPQAELDVRRTEHGPRHEVAGGLEVLIDGKPALLVDVSLMGAMVLSQTILRPNQRVRVTLPDTTRPLRLSGAVAWAVFEMPREGPRYRAGIEFLDPDVTALGQFIESNKANKG